MIPVLSIKDLMTEFKTDDGVVHAVDGIGFEIQKGETLGLVGESGSGKSVTALSIMGLLSAKGKVTNGRILFQEENLVEKTDIQMEKIRGNKISMVFQEPMTSLNPVMTVGDQIKEVFKFHQKVEEKDLNTKVLEILDLVKIPDAEQRVHEYPHQMSGGIRQRIMIAMALACKPELLICDEPTTALDVTVQAQILALIKELQTELHTSVLMITHDLGVVAQVADHVAVMYAGQIVEYSDTITLFASPKHPYTKGLLKTIPRLDIKQDSLEEITGIVPDLTQNFCG